MRLPIPRQLGCRGRRCVLLAFEGKDVAEVGGIARRKFVVFSKRLGIRLQKLSCHFYRWLAMLAIDTRNGTREKNLKRCTFYRRKARGENRNLNYLN